MGFVRLVRAALVLALIVCWFAITAWNPTEPVTINLPFHAPFESVPLVRALFAAFVVGGISGCAVALLWIVELQGKLRDAKRQARRLQGELTSLRNLPLDEADDVATETRS